MTNEDLSNEVNNPKAALQSAALEAILTGTTWYPLEDGAELPRRCRDLVPIQLVQLLCDGGVFSISIGGQRYVPDYAFDSTGNVFPEISELVQVFSESSTFHLASWMESSNTFLDGRRPREVLAMHPHLVVSSAKAHLQGPMHG